MADEIVQALGFDASAALDALAKMDSAFAGFDAQLSRTAESMSVWNEHGRDTVQVLNQIASGATAATAAMAKLSASFGGQAAGGIGGGAVSGGAASAAVVPPAAVKPRIDKGPIDDAEKSASKFTVSWETMTRVVTTQLIVRAMSAVRDVMFEAFESNLQFMTRVAEIQSVAPGVNTSLESIAQHVAALSREFNIPLAQVAEAQYQSISNQFASTAQQSDVLTAAFKLSKVAVMDAGNAVNLIAGALNSYQMDSSQAEAVAAKFFATIQVGRVRGEELAAVLSRVMAVSSTLGVSLDELNAMMVTLTVSGVKPAEAATALRSSMMALIKPSADLTKELRTLGFESGAQMIAAYGLEGTMLKLRESTDDNIAAFAKLIPNVRAISGALRETNDGGARTAQSLQHLHEVAAAEFQQKYKIFIESDAQRVLAEMNRLNVFLTTDLGATLVQSVSKLVGFAGGADTIAAAVKALVPPLTLAVAGAGAFVVTLGALTLEARLASMSMTGLGMALNGVLVGMAAYAAFNFADTKLSQGFRQAEANFDKEQNEMANIRARARERQIEQDSWADQETVRRANQALAEVRKDHFAMVDAAKADNQRLTEDTHATMNKIVEASEKQVHALRNVAQEANREIESSAKKSVEIAGTLADTRFRFTQTQGHETPAAQALEDAQRASSLAFEAEQRMSKAKTPQEAEAAGNVFKRAQAFAQEAMSAATRAKSTSAEYEAEQAIEGVLESELRAQEELRAHKQVQAHEAERAAAEEESRVTRMRELAKGISKDMDMFDRKGNLLAGPDRETAIAKTRADIQEFQNLMMTNKNWKPSEWLNFEDLKRKMSEAMEGAVTKVEVRDFSVAADSLVALNQRITAGLGAIEVRLKNPAPAAEKKKSAFDALMQGAEQQVQMAARSKELRDVESDRLHVLDQIRTKQGDIAGNMANQVQTMTSWWQSIKEAAVENITPAGKLLELQNTTKAAKAMLQGMGEEMLFLSQHPFTIDTKDLEKLQAKLSLLKTAGPWTVNVGVGQAEASYTRLKELFDLTEKVRSLDTKYPNLNEGIKQSTEEMDRLKKAFPEDKAGDLKNKVSQTGDAVEGLSMQPFISQIDMAIAKMDQLAAAVAAVPSPRSGGLTAAHGGLAFLAGGGRPQGTDVIPAMLSPGEMVMSATATRRFASQLTAMNAGSKPSYHSQGGHVTNVGDINVTVEGGGTGRQTARSIATELRRELRRGTSVL